MRAAMSVSGALGVVCSGAAEASDAGLAVLTEGGTAVDAAVAASAVLCVCLPHATGLGGDMFALVHRADPRLIAINASGTAPRRTDTVGAITAPPPERDRDALRFGPLAATVPGMVHGWADLLREGGRMGLDTLLQPALAYARDGVAVSPAVAAAARRMAATLAADPGAANLLLPGGGPVEAGQRLHQPELARTLARIGERGWREFYEGETAAALAATVAQAEGLLDETDLAGYRTICGPPLTGTYRGRQIYVPGPNSYAQLLLLQFAVLETEEPERWAADPSSWYESLRRGRQAAFDAGLDAIGATDPHDADAAQAALPGLMDRARQLYEERRRAAPADPSARGGTSTVVCADRDGTVVVIVQSLFRLFGANLRCPRTGILFNDRMFGFAGVADTTHIGGSRPPHTLSPSLVRTAGDVVALASPGSIGQTVTLAQVVSGWLDRGLDLAAAVDAPRWNLHVDTQEALIEDDAVPAPPGMRVVPRGSDATHGAVTVAAWDGAGSTTAVADGRRAVAARGR